MAEERFIGLMSGTSLDGVDASLLAFRPEGMQVLAHQARPFPPELRTALDQLCQQASVDPIRLASASGLLTGHYVDAVAALLDTAELAPEQITAIGCHGQTIRHLPAQGLSWQIGQPAVLARRARIPVVADFRSGDLAAGGQGAPLAPAFHRAFFHDPQQDRVVVNIGGIANLTDLPAEGPLRGWDTGPGNTLMDAWHRRHRHGHWDEDGRWAASGTPSPELLTRLLDDDYFRLSPPKSTGTDHFSPAWLARRLEGFEALAPEDVQATLLRLSVESLATDIERCPARQVILCGGGGRNQALVSQLRARLPEHRIQRSDAFGLGLEQVEASAFAWLARQRWLGQAGNAPGVTGADGAVCLGAIWLP